jgi:hypothetical protein
MIDQSAVLGGSWQVTQLDQLHPEAYIIDYSMSPNVLDLINKNTKTQKPDKTYNIVKIY